MPYALKVLLLGGGLLAGFACSVVRGQEGAATRGDTGKVVEVENVTPASRPDHKGMQRLDWIEISKDGRHFVEQRTQRRFLIWGFNYDHDEQGRLLEDYWHDEWETVVEDFREMKELRANVVRIHLQLPRFMTGPNQVNPQNLARLGRLVSLAEEVGLYLDVTGLGCYHKQDVPDWYDVLSEQERWDVQANFWRHVATVCRQSPAILCYDLMNEPILPGRKPETEWLAGELGGKFFVQRISLDLGERTREAVATAWVKHLASAIRAVDDKHLLTVGVIPWAYVFPGAKPLFYGPEAGEPLDFVSVHFYPKAGDVAGALAALKVYDIGKPLVVEEFFPLKCSLKEAAEFIDTSREICDGWISFYWGKTIEEYAETPDMKSQILAAWLRYFRDHPPGEKTP
ncbi:MAG: cellulase family glycosylhydrolase [Planctomycetaceae bacterium]